MFKKLNCLILIGLIMAISGQATAGIRTAEELLVDLRADDLDYGSGTTIWINHGTLDDFTAMGVPVVEDVDGRKAVTFDGSSYFEGPLSPEGIHGGGTRSIEVWAYNGTDLVGEETMVSWSHRGGPDGTNIGFNYGNNTTWGAVGHWGTAGDMPWSAPHAPAPEPLNWWHLVYTYDGTTVRFYVNGEENTTRDVTLNTHGPNIIRVAAQADTTGASVQADLNFTGSIAEVRIHDGVLSAADVAFNFLNKPGDPIAENPSPADGEVDVPRDTALSWDPSEFAATHNVYLGTVFEDVNTAEVTNPMDVLASQGQIELVYDPIGLLEYDTAYYWRVDEVNAAPDNTVYRGDVWSFTTEPFAYPITDVQATTNGVSDAGNGPEKAVDGSGLDEDDAHATEPTDMWLATPPADGPLYLECAFDKIYKLHQALVWNHNSAFELYLGFGVKDVTIEYSVDGADWTVLGDAVIDRAPGLPGYDAYSTVDLEGVTAQYVRVIINSTYLSTGKRGLSEVRFLYIPVQAGAPEPADGATDVDVDTDLSWRAGRDAAQHDVYLDTVDATTLVATTQAASYEPGTLDLGTTYSWKVDEVNEAEPTSTWEGLVWSFSTRDYFLVDDFETYTDDSDAGEAIYQTWLDGYEDGDLGGSIVGNDPSPFAEKEIVYSGGQSMPLFYDNTASPYFSETERTWTTPQDWSRGGATTLVVYFHGDFDNDVDPLYAKINGTRIPFDGGAEVIARPLWRQWNIDLTTLNVQSVRTVTIGIGDGSPGGDGVLYIDAIRLYRVAPASAAPADPGTDGLSLHYTFDGNVSDSSANGYAAAVMGNEIYDNSPYDGGRAMSFDGINDYLELPIGPLMAASDSMTIATRFNMLPNVNNWQRIFDFGTSTAEGYMFLSPQMGTAGAMRFAITATNNVAGNEFIVDSKGPLAEGWHHVAVVIDAATMTITLYLDGAEIGSVATEVVPSQLGQTTQNWLGRSQYEGDGYYMGLLDEFRIYNRALSAGEVRHLAGDR